MSNSTLSRRGFLGAAAGLVVTFANRRREVEELLGGTRVVAISFIPSEETRLAPIIKASGARVE